MSEPLPKFDGFFDGIADNHACGWLYSADAPRTRLEVELVADDQVVGRGIANCFRQNLLEAGIGDGKHAFSIALPASLRDGAPHQLTVREAYTGQPLAGGAKRFRAEQPSSSTAQRPDHSMPASPTGATSIPSSPPAAGAPAPEIVAPRVAAATGSPEFGRPAVRVQGAFERVSDGRAIGWVFSPDAPGTRLEVEIICGDRIIGRGLANVERADLVARGGVGDGRHGFDLPIDVSLCQDDQTPVFAREAYTGQPLSAGSQPQPTEPAWESSAGPPPIPAPAAQAPAPTAAPQGRSEDHRAAPSHEQRAAPLDEPLSVRGHFDDLLNGNADGWVFFPERPQLRAEVEVLCDGRVVARGEANLLRPDLREAGISDGCCAFSLALDRSLFDGQPHQIVVREQRSGQTLDGSPKQLLQRADGSELQQEADTAPSRSGAEALSPPSLRGRLEAVRNGKVEGWVVDLVDPLRRLEVEVFCDGQLQGRCAADLYRPDLAEAGVGDGRHAFSLALSSALFDGREHSLSVRACDPQQLLEGSPLVSRLQAPLQPESAPTGAADLAEVDQAGRDHAAVDSTVVLVGGRPHARDRDLDTGAPPASAIDLEPSLAKPPEPAAGQQQASQPEAAGIGLVAEPADARQQQLELPQPPEVPGVEQLVPPPIPAPEPELQGRFEGIVNGQVCGWALDPLRPEQRVELEILCDGAPIARTRADLERDDLVEVMLGDGRHGFRLTLDSSLFDGRPHQLSVRALRTQQLLPGSPQQLHSEAPPARVRPADVQGAFESIAGTRALGYAWDHSRPEHRLEVEILCEGEVVGRAAANTFRRDLYETGIGDGRHAFAAPISYELFDAQPHWLTAREAHTGKSLTHGPHLFEQARAQWPFDLMPRGEALSQFDALIAEPQVKGRAQDAADCRSSFVDACLRQEMRQTEAARVIYRQLLERLGENALCHCKLAETWLLDGEPDPALDAYRRAAALPSPLFWAYLGIGNALKLRDQFVEAEDAFHSALQISPRQPLVLRRLAEVRTRAVPLRVDRLVAAGQLDEGIRLLKTRLIEEPENPMILDKLSTLLERQEGPRERSDVDDDDAVAAFDSSLRVLELLLADGERQQPPEGQR